MKFLNELLGFAVLTGPLWLILILLPVSIWIAVKVAKRFKQRSAKFGIGFLVFLLVFLAPFADEITGSIYFDRLCATEAGVKMYQTVELLAKYWDEGGKPRFFNKHGYLEHDFWVEVLDESGARVVRHSSIFAIDKRTSPVKERSSQKVLAEVTTFLYWGGWMRRNLSPHNTASSCKFTEGPSFSRSFYGQLFKPAASAK